MRTERKFARVYYDDFISEFPSVYGSDALLACWLRLLVVAEKMWPTTAELPRSARARSVDQLVKAGLVELVPPHGYRIRGLDAERSRRSNAARNAAALRWQSDRSADGSAETMPSTSTSTRREEDPPNPPRGGGRRSNGTNPRAVAAIERDRERAVQQRRALEATQVRVHESGGHFDTPNPTGCPRCRVPLGLAG